MLFMSLAGFAAAPYYVVEQSLMQRLVPKNVQGQVCRPEYPYTRMSVKVQKNGLLMLEISVLKLEKVPESALILEKCVLLLTNYRNIPKGLSQNSGTKEAGFFDGMPGNKRTAY
jgi:hypothetical protein